MLERARSRSRADDTPEVIAQPARDLPRARPSRSSSTTARPGKLVPLHAERTIDEVLAEIQAGARRRSRRAHDHPQVARSEIELMARAGAVVAETLALVEERLEPGHLDGRARPHRRRVHPLARRRPDLEGLQGLPGRDVHLAERDDRARHPGRVPRAGGRHHLGRRRRHARTACRRLRRDVPGRRDLGRGAAAARRLPGGARRRDRAGARRQRRSATSPPRCRRSTEEAGFSVVRSLVGHGVGRSIPRGAADPELRQPVPRARSCARG